MDINTCFATTESYRALAFYSHLVPGIAVFILGLFAYLRAHNRVKATYFAGFTAMLTIWLAADLVVWTANNYSVVAAFWEPLDYIEILFFLLLFGFLIADLRPNLLMWTAPVLLLAAGLPFFITAMGNAVYEMYQPVCEMVGNDMLAHYKVWLEGTLLVTTFILGFPAIFSRKTNWNERVRVLVIVCSVILFMGIFSWSEYVATSTGIFEINLAALFTLPLFVLGLTIAITSYGTFKLGNLATRALFCVFLVLALTQFFWVEDITEFLLAGMSFCVVLTLGIMLFRASEREMRQRIQIEAQEKELQIVNRQQESLLHFISHEVKGYLTDGQNAFASIVEGDLGHTTAKVFDVSQTALSKMRQGVQTVMEILDASNLKQGTVSYRKARFDMRDVVEDVVEQLRPKAAEKKLTLNLSIDTTKTFSLTGDKEKIAQHVIRNLVDNSIRYTQKGSILVTLTKSSDHIRFSVKDTGVGITPEDKQKLFTEGGHGKESIKVNVDSTGYGLFVAKQVVEAHGGTIWAESAGAGQGSEFVVELPAA